jgi:hypothetical protein
MSPRSAGFVLVLILGVVAGCGGGGGGGKPSSAKEPKNAREKQLQEAKASGEVDATGQPSWGKWRYSGDRDNCFFAVGRRCFKTEVAACQALRCKAGKKCQGTGAGPVTVSCAK